MEPETRLVYSSGFESIMRLPMEPGIVEADRNEDAVAKRNAAKRHGVARPHQIHRISSGSVHAIRWM